MTDWFLKLKFIFEYTAYSVYSFKLPPKMSCRKHDLCTFYGLGLVYVMRAITLSYFPIYYSNNIVQIFIN